MLVALFLQPILKTQFEKYIERNLIYNMELFVYTELEQAYINKRPIHEINVLLKIKCIKDAESLKKTLLFVKSNEDIVLYFKLPENRECFRFLNENDIMTDSDTDYIGWSMFNLTDKVLNMRYILKEILKERIKFLTESNNIKEFEETLKVHLISIFKKLTITNSILVSHPYKDFSIDECIKNYSFHYILYVEFLCALIFISDFNNLNGQPSDLSDPQKGNSGTLSEGSKGKFFGSKSNPNHGFKVAERTKAENNVIEIIKTFILDRKSVV